MSRRLLNCWLVAMGLWLSSLFSKPRRYFWKRRSYSFKGMIMHSGVAEGVRWKSLSVIEYIPPKHDLGTSRNLLFLFAGKYRVWHFRLEAVQRFETREEALAFAYLKKGV